MSKLYLGVDGGQSSTTALIADESGRVIGTGRGGPCNHVSSGEGREKFFRAVGGCLQQACEQAGLATGTVAFASACLGFSGGAADKDAYSRELIRSEKFLITHDAAIALAGATAGEPGIIIIAGTGSMAFGRNADGRTARGGGWGYVFGDEGGGFDLTRRALRAALRFEEGWGAVTRLHRDLLAATGAADANDLLHRFYTSEFPRPSIAALSKLVDQAAEEGDDEARQILLDAAASLFYYVKGVYSNLFAEGQAVPIATIGSVFRSNILRNHFTGLVRQINSLVEPPAYGPAAGALLEALRADQNSNPLSNVPELEK